MHLLSEALVLKEVTREASQGLTNKIGKANCQKHWGDIYNIEDHQLLIFFGSGLSMYVYISLSLPIAIYIIYVYIGDENETDKNKV